MTGRSRLRQDIYTGWRKLKFPPGSWESLTYQNLSERCDDVINLGDNNPFEVTSYEKYGGQIYGEEQSTLTGYLWSYYPCTYMSDPFLLSHLAVSDVPSHSVLATRVVRRTNPSRAKSVFLEYAAELPGYGKKAKGLFEDILTRNKFLSNPRFRNLRRAAKLNLLAQFGLLPLLSDIELLMNFQAAVDKRMEEIKRLSGERGLRRSVDLWEGSSIQTVPSATIQSQGVFLRADLVKRTSIKIRGHIRWRALTATWLKNEATTRSVVRKALLGYSIDPSTLYELMPWSWLIDYFTNLGEVVQSTRNMFDAGHDAVRIMTHTRTFVKSYNTTTDGVKPWNVTATPIVAISESKKRQLATPSLGTRIEYLNEAQWSILGSLAVLRGL